MVHIEKVDTDSKSQVNEFVQFHYDLYKGTPQWVPPFRNDIKMMLNRKKHPFFEHSEGEFFIARQDGKMVGRIAVLENKPYNQFHNSKKAQFYLFDAINDKEVAAALFDRAAEWAKARGLTEILGPKGLSAFDGYGIQVTGFEHRQMMTMMNYNFPYYPELMEAIGYARENDFVSCYIPKDKFVLPEKVREIARRVEERGSLKVKNFKNRKELMSWARQIGEAYNETFVNNWEYYPLSQNEIKYLVDNVITIADPKLIKLIMHKDDIVGFLFAFPDVSAALQRHDGRLTPWALADIFLEMKRTKWVSLNGVGVVQQFQGRGGNALMYNEMVKTIEEYGFIHAEETQMADTAEQVRKDMVTIGAEIYKIHRIFRKEI